jgi:dihydropteroate synthase
MIRVLNDYNSGELKQLMREIQVDPYAIKIMLPKAITHLLKIDSVSNITANILKQEMLSLGGDVAVARSALTGKNKMTDCLLIGNLSQFKRLKAKLYKQPFGLAELSLKIARSLNNFQKDRFTINLNGYKLFLGKRVYIMGIVNLTPDSFSGDGLYRTSSTKYQISKIVDFVERTVQDGADIIDVGGESTHPGAKPISVKEELARTIPIIKILAKKIKVPISIDTYKKEVAKLALDNGAVIVNDITALKDPGMARLIARYKAGVVLMHMQGNPRNMQNNPAYSSLVSDIITYLDRAIQKAKAAGIAEDKIIIDPGIGFGKTLEHNLEILKRLQDFKVLGRPILVGPSRKSFIGKILNLEAQKRIFGTVSACVLAAKFQANIVRVHDVRPVYEALKITRAILNAG